MDILRHLPQNHSVRWSVDRKIAVVLAVHLGVISLEEVKIRFALGIREFREWEKLIDGPAVGSDERMQSDNVIELKRPDAGVQVPKQTKAEAA